jgi:predicted O-methyltransferase YrrM
MERTYKLDTICARIRQGWKENRLPLSAAIEDIYTSAGIEGKLDPHDQHYYLSALYSIVATIRPRRIIQTGTYVGGSTLAMALALRDSGIDGRIDTIDPEPNCYGNLHDFDPVGIARTAVQQAGLSAYVRFHRGYSVMAWDKDRINITDAPEGTLYNFVAAKETDLVIVDGDHTLNGTFWDMEIGARTLGPDGPGLLFVHDYKAIPSVREAIRYWKHLNSDSFLFRGCSERNGFALLQRIGAAEKENFAPTEVEQPADVIEEGQVAVTA